VFRVTPTLAIASYAALLATANLIWILSKDLRDRRERLKLWAFVGRRLPDAADNRSAVHVAIGPGGTQRIAHDFLIVKVTNVGAKPVRVELVGFRTGPPDREQILLLRARNLPKLLEPSEVVGEFSTDVDVAADPFFQIFVETSLGKRFYAPRKAIEGVIQGATSVIARRKEHGQPKA